MIPDGTGFWAGELDGLVGCDPLLSAVRELIDSGDRTVVVTGLPGSGKTSVLTVATRALAAEGRLVIRATGYESDRELAFGVLVDVLAHAPEGAEVLGQVLPDPDRPRAVDPLLLRLRVLSWLERLGESRPVVLVADDLQWFDDSTLSVLGFVANRLADSDVSLLAATRDEVPPPPLRHHPQLAIPALAEADARVLLRRAGLANAPAWVIERAAGNPLALLELGRAVAAGVPDAPPSTVEVAFRGQVAALPEATRRALLLAAAGEGDLTVLGRTTDPAQLLEALAPAEEADLATVVDRVVRFRHPLVAAAVYGTATTSDRLAAHSALAAAYDGDDAERAAWHRSEATLTADEDVARALVLASSLAIQRGASSEGARMMARASQLSPARSDREERLLAAVQINANAGNFDWVIATGGRLQHDAQDPVVRARAAHATAYALAQTERSGAARRALVGALEQLIDIDPELGWNTLTTLAVLVYRTGSDRNELSRWLEVYEAVTDPAEPTDYPALRPAARAWIRMQIDPLSNAEEILDLVCHAPVPEYPPGLVASHEMLLGAAAWVLDQPGVARERLERAVDLMRDADAFGEMAGALIALALVQIQSGDYDAADQSGRLAIDIAESRNQRYGQSDGQEIRARVAALRGDTARARELSTRVLQELPLGEATAIELSVAVTMSWVRLADGDARGAWNEVRVLFDDDGGPTHPHLSYQALGHYAASAARAGELEHLAAVIAAAERRMPRPRAFHRLQLARARALVGGDDAEPWHLRAIRTRGAAQWPLELAHARLEWGAWLRRRHRLAEARDQLQQALSLLERLGARVSAELAASELRAAGVAVHDPEQSAWSSLTPQEREVVRLAATGLTNQEIAAALFLSPRTVSTHLYNAFPKLGVSSRGQLRDVAPEPG